MKAVRGILIAALVLVVSTQAFALTSPPWSGNFRATLSTWSVSRFYTGYLAGYGPASNPNPDQWIPAMGATDIRKTYSGAEIAQLDYFDPPMAASPNETSWGVFRWESVKAGTPNGGNQMNTGGTDIWSDDGKQLVGIFYGQQDSSVTFQKPLNPQLANKPTKWEQYISSYGAKYKMWYQDRGIFPEITDLGQEAGAVGMDINGNGTTMMPPLGSPDWPFPSGSDLNDDGVEDGEEAWRRRNLTVDPTGGAFEGIGYWTWENQNDGLGTQGQPIPNQAISELVLFGNSYDTAKDYQDEIAVYFNPNSQTQGDMSTFIKLVNDPMYSWQPWTNNPDSYFMRIFPYQMDKYEDFYQMPPGLEAHLYLHAVSARTNYFGWSLSSDGATAIHGSVVPEPVTMISLALSGAGLVGYLRRRRNK